MHLPRARQDVFTVGLPVDLPPDFELHDQLNITYFGKELVSTF